MELGEIVTLFSVDHKYHNGFLQNYIIAVIKEQVRKVIA